MKILHVVPGIGTVYGGPSLAVLNLAEWQARQGVQVDVVTTNLNGAQLLDVPLKTWVEDRGFRVQYFPCWHFKDYKFSRSMSQWLKRHVRDYDIVNTHAIFAYTNLPAYQACQRDLIPYIIHPHGMLEPWALGYKRWKKQPYYDLIEKSALDRAAAIRVLAIPEAESVGKLDINTPLALIPNGIAAETASTVIDTSVFYKAFPETAGKTTILFLGRIDPKKGLDLLATAFAKASQAFPHIQLVVAGPDNTGYLATAKQYFLAAQCLDRVTFTGMIEGDLKAAALAIADIYVAPSYSEGFSMSVLEGMVSGLPCVITIGCNFPEAAAAGVAHVVEINADAIANALILCLKEPEAAQAMGSLARQFVLDNYTWDKIATDINALSQDILDNQNSSKLNAH